MARLKCPSCGNPYNGKRCRNCLYEHFSEEIAHGNHTHEGEPLVIDAPVRKPIRRAKPFDCDTRTKKRRIGRLPVLLAVLLALIGPVLDIVTEIVSDTISEVVHTAPEPLPIPEDGLTLYEDDSLRIIADWENGQAYEDGIRIYAENNSDYDLTVTAQEIIVNGWMMETSYLYCEAQKGRQGMGTLTLDEEYLRYAGISAVTEISFYLDIWDQDTYNSVAVSPRITLLADSPETLPEQEIIDGQLLYESEGIRVTCLGYYADEYEPDVLHEGKILFLIENNTDHYLHVWSPVIRVNDQDTTLSLWNQLHPDTRAIGTMYLYGLEELELTSLDQLELTLEFADRDDYNYSEQSDMITVNLQ